MRLNLKSHTYTKFPNRSLSDDVLIHKHKKNNTTELKTFKHFYYF